MATKQIFFFSDLTDIKNLLEIVELSENIQYCEAGTFDFFDTPIYSTFAQLPNLGSVEHGDWVLNRFYAIIPDSDNIRKREIYLNKGGIRYAIYQDNNPKSVIFKPSGIFKDNILVAGSIGTISTDPFSLNLFNKFSKTIKKKNSSKHKNFTLVLMLMPNGKKDGDS